MKPEFKVGDWVRFKRDTGINHPDILVENPGSYQIQKLDWEFIHLKDKDHSDNTVIWFLNRFERANSDVIHKRLGIK